MKIRLLHWYKARRRQAAEASDAGADVHATVEAQWPEVLALSAWAKNTREKNHLTEMFYDRRGLRGGKP